MELSFTLHLVIEAVHYGGKPHVRHVAPRIVLDPTSICLQTSDLICRVKTGYNTY